MEHAFTPGPWKLSTGIAARIGCANTRADTGVQFVADCASLPEGEATPEDCANAARIVQCVNAYDELVALLRETLKPGAYGVGSTLAVRIAKALGEQQA